MAFAASFRCERALGQEPFTLDALAKEEVQTFLFVDGLAIDGSLCTRCDYFSAPWFAACPFCSGEAEHTDISDRAVEKTILTSVDVEAVSSREGRDRLLAEGGLGALLRY